MDDSLSFEQMFPGLSAVSQYLKGLKPIRFDDGTWQLRIENKKSCIVYSPKLKPLDLDIFCYNNLDKYEKFYNENWDDINGSGPLPAMKIFWINEKE